MVVLTAVIGVANPNIVGLLYLRVFLVEVVLVLVDGARRTVVVVAVVVEYWWGWWHSDGRNYGGGNVGDNFC